MCTLISYTFLGTMKANLIVLTPTERIDSLADVLARPRLTIYFPIHTPAERILYVSDKWLLISPARLYVSRESPSFILQRNPVFDFYSAAGNSW